MKLEKIYNYCFLLVAIFPLFNIRNASFVVFFWCLLSLFVAIKLKTYKLIKKRNWQEILVLSLYYIFILINYLVSYLDKELLKFVETDALLLLFPLFVILNKEIIYRKTIKRSLLAFFISNIILALISWFYIIEIGYFTLLEQNNYYQPVFRNLFFKITQIHLPYLGMLFAFSIVIGFTILVNNKITIFIKFLISISILLLVLSIFTFSARMSLLTLFIVGVFALYMKLKNKVLKIVIPLVFLLSTILLITFTPVKERFIELKNSELKLPSKELNDKSHLVNFRYGIYYCSYQVIKNDFLFGIGKNNVAKRLNSCYDTFSYSNFDDFTKKNYNTHNQYVDIIMSYGIIGFILLFVSLFFGFFKTSDKLYKLFLVLIFMALLTENLFERQVGVMFFAFFNSLFFLNKRII